MEAGAGPRLGYSHREGGCLDRVGVDGETRIQFGPSELRGAGSPRRRAFENPPETAR